MKKKQLFTLTLLLGFTLVVNAQGPPPPPPGLAIDGGLIFLIVSGILYGIKKVKDK